MFNKILVATDGKPGALGALRTARQLAKRSGARVEVLAVYEPMDAYAVARPETVASIRPYFTPEAVEAVRRRVEAQLAEVGGEAASWPVAIEMGRVAPTIARTAAERDADLILLGLRQPRAVERWLARETLLRLIHLSHVPILAVPEEAIDLPRHGVVAVDFSDFSLRVGRAALELLAPDARLDLVHVTWPSSEPSEVEWVRTYRCGVKQRLKELAAELDSPGQVEVRSHVFTGSPGSEVLLFAEEACTDLIAAGSHGAGFLGRILLGSVSGKLAHRAQCSLLIAPPETVVDELLAVASASDAQT